jgi:exosortase A
MSAVLPAPTFSWRHALIAIVLVELALIVLYRETAWAMVSIWQRSETFSHAFLVPPIALWLIWERHAALARVIPHPAPWLAIPLAVFAFIWLLGDLAAVNAVTQLAFVAMLVLAVPLVIGVSATRLIVFPLGFLFFAVPIGEFVMPKLMEWTAAFTVMGLRASGIPVYQEGLHFVIPSGRWSVVEACSGVRYLIASITVGTLFAYLNYQSLKRRLIFVCVAILVPIVANWARAYLIVMLGHLSGNTLAVGVDHLIYGWVFFGVVMLIMFTIGLRWREIEPALLPPTSVATVSSSVAPSGGVVRFGAAAVISLAVAVAPQIAFLMFDSGPKLPPPTLETQTLGRNEWQLTGDALTEWRPAFTNPSATMNATLVKGEQRVGVFISWYQQQGYDHKLISSENVLARSNDQVWAQVGRDVARATLSGQAVTVRSSVLRDATSAMGVEPFKLRVWHWYWIGGRIVTSDHLGKLWLAMDRLMGRGDNSAAVFVYAQEDYPGGGEAALANYLEQAGDGIIATLVQAVGREKR